MIAPSTPRSRTQEAILAHLQMLLGGEPDFQVRLDAPKDQDVNIELAKARRLIEALILRDSTSFKPRSS
jgi:hypothetical protein